MSTIGAGTTPTLGRSPLHLVRIRLQRDPAAMVSLAAIIVLIAFALCAPLVAAATGHPAEITNVDTGTDAFGQPLPPGSGNLIFGGDNLGRDILVRVAYGTRISLLVGLSATLLATVLGVVVGLVSGYYGGWIDALLARVMDVVLSFPYLLFGLALVSVYGPSLALTIFVIAFFSWATIGRVARGQALSHRQKEYVEAARSLGASDARIMFVDILPNLLAPVIVLATLLVPTAIIFESSLSYLGLGITPPAASLGNMLAQEQQCCGFQAWWFLLFPAGTLVIATVSFNLLGDALRDALDPSAERLLAAAKKQAGA